MTRHARTPMVVALTLCALLAACGDATSDTSAAGSAAGRAGEQAIDGELVVFAAASLTDAFDALGAAFADLHPAVEVVVNYGPSSGLSTQIQQGAPADVFASAAPAQMDAIVAAGLAASPMTFAGNVLAIAVEPGNPLGITVLADLTDPDLLLVLANPEVPVGQYGAEALGNAELAVTPASLEADVRTVLSKVVLGEADAGIVFASDVLAAGEEVGGVEIPAEDNVSATYPIAVLHDAPNPGAAKAFVAYVLSNAGAQTLAAFGFTTP